MHFRLAFPSAAAARLRHGRARGIIAPGQAAWACQTKVALRKDRHRASTSARSGGRRKASPRRSRTPWHGSSRGLAGLSSLSPLHFATLQLRKLHFRSTAFRSRQTCQDRMKPAAPNETVAKSPGRKHLVAGAPRAARTVTAFPVLADRARAQQNKKMAARLRPAKTSNTARGFAYRRRQQQ